MCALENLVFICYYYSILGNEGGFPVKISTKGRYALRMMLDLAEHQGDGYVALKDIAQRQGISKKYLEQIVPMLGRADVLRTTRGWRARRRSIPSVRSCA